MNTDSGRVFDREITIWKFYVKYNSFFFCFVLFDCESLQQWLKRFPNCLLGAQTLKDTDSREPSWSQPQGQLNVSTSLVIDSTNYLCQAFVFNSIFVCLCQQDYPKKKKGGSILSGYVKCGPWKGLLNLKIMFFCYLFLTSILIQISLHATSEISGLGCVCWKLC